MRSRLARLIAACLVCGSTVVGQSISQKTTIFVPVGGKVRNAWHEDVSGDGKRDVVVGFSLHSSTQPGATAQRVLHVHADQSKPNEKKSRFNQTPNHVLQLPRWVVACAVGDVFGDAGAEIVLFGTRGAYAWRPKAEARSRVVELAKAEFLFQYPAGRNIYSWQQGVRDIDGDGRVDLLLPEPAGLTLAVQRRDAQGKVSFLVSKLEIPKITPSKHGASTAAVSGSVRDDGADFQLSLGLDSEGKRGPLVRVSESIPAPQLIDWDGDSDLDLLMMRGERVFVWIQTDGRFQTKPDAELAFPLDEERTSVDTTFSALLTDYNADKRADAIVLSRAPRRDEDVYTHVMFFDQRAGEKAPLFHGGEPQQLLKISSFTTDPRIKDVNGDGHPDLLVGNWDVNATDQSVDVSLQIFLNRKGRFARTPSLAYEMRFGMDRMGKNRVRPFVRAIGDVNGDGISDLLRRRDSTGVQLLLMRRKGKGLTVLDRPLDTVAVAPKAKIQFLPFAQKPPGFMVLEPGQVLLVTY